MKIRSLLFGLAVAIATSAVALAQGDYPNQRVTIVVPFGAGSVTDIMIRAQVFESGKAL